MKLIKTTLFLSFFTSFIWAQPNGAISPLHYIKDYTDIEFESKSVLSGDGLFGLSADHTLNETNQYNQPNGRKHTRYKQYYKSIRVLGHTVVTHEKAGKLYSISGMVAKFENLSVEAVITVHVAENAAKIQLMRRLQIEENELPLNFMSDVHIKDIGFAIADEEYPNESGKFTLVYTLHMVSDSKQIPIDYTVLVNAETGEGISAISNIETTTVEGHGDGFYHKDVTFNVDSISPNEYILRDDTRGQGIFAYNLLDDENEFTDEDNEWVSENEVGGAVIEGYYATGKFYDFLQEKFNRNSIDDDGYPLKLKLNRHTYVNAFWNGDAATFGTGNCNSYNPLSSFEVVAHEFTHGLTDYTSDLIYRNESGALNESMSDIFAKAFEHFYDNGNFNWLIGGNLPKNENVNIFRSMEDPNVRFDPKFYKGEFWHTATSDNGGVHSNSGVLNHWFYLLVSGGSGTNEADYTYNINGIGMEDAIQIAYHMQVNYLTESSNYFAAAQYSAASAIDLFGEQSTQLAAIKETWLAVGIDLINFIDVQLVNLSTQFEGSSATNQLICPQKLQNFDLSFRNSFDNIIPMGTVFDGFITVGYNNGIEYIETDISLPQQILSEDLGNFDQVDYNLDLQIMGDPDAINIKADLTIVSPDTTEFKYFSDGNIEINKLTTVEFEFYLSSHNSFCTEFADFSFDYTSIRLPNCQMMPDARLDFIYTSPLGTDLYSINIDDIEESEFTIFSVFEEVDLQSLGPINTIELRIEYYNGEDSELLYEESYKDLYGTEIIEPTLFTFDDPETSAGSVSFESCPICDVNFENGEIEITDNLSTLQVEDCIPVKEYMTTLSLYGGLNLSELGVCVELFNIDEPILVFDIKQIDNPNFSSPQNDFVHLVDVVYQDDFGTIISLLSEPITNTNNEYQSYEIPITQPTIENIKFNIVSIGTSTYLDNIGIKSGLQVATKNENLLDFDISYNNPVSNILEIRTKQIFADEIVISLMDVSGQIVAQKLMQDQRLHFDMDEFANGIYFINAFSENKYSIAKKVVKVD